MRHKAILFFFAVCFICFAWVHLPDYATTPKTLKIIALFCGAIGIYLLNIIPKFATISFSFFMIFAYFPEWHPEGVTPVMVKVTAVAFLMASLWITEAIPIPATSIIPIALFPLLGILETSKITPAYGDKMIILLMGGFFIATVIEKVNLHKRIALNVIYKIGTNPRQLLLGFMVATAFLSMWISNTATTLMMLPIALAVSGELESKYPKKEIATAFLLGIAYSASVGGVGTPIGTPPNLIMLSQYEEALGKYPQFANFHEISFASWMIVGIPCVVLLIAFMWMYMSYRFGLPANSVDNESQEIIEKELAKLGKMSKPEKYTFILFVITSCLWIFRQDINLEIIVIPGWETVLGLKGFVHDTTVAILMAIVMFTFPINETERLLDWQTAKKIPWGMLLLFGGGIALARGFEATGLSQWLGDNLQVIKNLPVILIIAIICLFITFLTEVTSNTAVTTIMMPILALTAAAIDKHPALLMVPAAISASFAFMLPVATAPNAIMYSTEKFTIATMAKVGFYLNLFGALVVTIICYFLGTTFVFQ